MTAIHRASYIMGKITKFPLEPFAQLWLAFVPGKAWKMAKGVRIFAHDPVQPVC